MCRGKKKPLIEPKCLYCPLVACDCMLPPWLRAKVRQSYCNYQWGQNPVVQVPCPGSMDYRSWWCKQLRKQLDICTHAQFSNGTASTSYDANQSKAPRQCSQICWCSNNVTSRSVANIPSFAYQSSVENQCTDSSPPKTPAIHQDLFDTTANKSLPNIPYQPQFSPSEQNQMTCVHEVEVRNWSMDKNYQMMDNCNNCQLPQPQFNQLQQHQQNQTQLDQTLINQTQLTPIEQNEPRLNETTLTSLPVQQKQLNQSQPCQLQLNQQSPFNQAGYNQPPLSQPQFNQTQYTQSEQNPLQMHQTQINHPLLNQPQFNKTQLNQTQFNESELNKLQCYAPAYPNTKNAGNPCCQGPQGFGGNLTNNTGNFDPNAMYPPCNKRGRWSFKDFISKKTHASAPAPQLGVVLEQAVGTCAGCQCRYPPAYDQICAGLKDGTCNCGQK